MRGKEIYFLGNCVRKLRKELIGSQKDFAHILGVSEGYVCEIETNGALPSRELLKKMAGVLRVQEGYLLKKSQAQRLRMYMEKLERREEIKE